MANNAFEDGIKSGNYDSVILMCGGSASGKTEYINTQLLNRNVIIVDSTLSYIDSITIKLQKIKNKMKIVVIFIRPASLLSCFTIFLNRKRLFHYSHFVRTHSGARQVFLHILENFTDIECKYFISELSPFEDLLKGSKVGFLEVDLTRQEMIQAILNTQISQEEINKIIEPFI